VTSRRRDAAALEVPENDAQALAARTSPEVLLDHGSGLRVRFVGALGDGLAVAVLARDDDPPTVAVEGLATATVAAAHVLALPFDAPRLRHARVQLVPDLHHLLDRLVHVRAGLREVKDRLHPGARSEVLADPG